MQSQAQQNQSVLVSKKAVDYDYLFKVLVIGESGSGKTSIITRYVDETFYESCHFTIGIDFKIKRVSFEDKEMKLQIWDTAGQERFRTITSAYYRGCHGIFVVYDVTNKDSFANVEKWVSEARKQAPKDANIVLIGNKSDLESRREISYDVGYQVASSLGVSSFFEVSAKTGSNIREAFDELIPLMRRTADERMMEEAPVIKSQLQPMKQENPALPKRGCC